MKKLKLTYKQEVNGEENQRKIERYWDFKISVSVEYKNTVKS